VYCPLVVFPTILRSTPGIIVVVIEPTEDEIRELCARAAAADSSELQEVVAALRAALKRHADQVRLIKLKTIRAFPPSKSKAAD
jgi:hypothetical protein